MEDISIVYGDTRTYRLTMLDENGDPATLTALEFTAKQTPYDEVPLFSHSTVEGGIALVSGGTTGLADLTITGEDLEQLANHWHTLVFDVRHFDGDGDPVTPLRGVLRVLPSMMAEQDSS